MNAWLVFAAVVALVFAALAGIVVFHALTGLLRWSFDHNVRGLWKAALSEIPAFLRIASWGLFGSPRLEPEDVGEDEPVVVVLVHGALADGSCTTGWAKALRKAGVKAPIVAPDHGTLVRPLEVHTARVQSFVQRVRLAAPNARLIFVGHSMGGLVIRKLLADDDEVREATVGVVTVASPHMGTQAVRALPFLLAHLKSGHAGFSTLPPLSKLVKQSWVVGSDVDAIVYPKSTTLLDGSEAISFDDVGHAAFLVREDVAERVAGLVIGMIGGVTVQGDSVSSAA